MRKPTLTFAVVIAVAVTLIGYQFLQLRAARDAAAQLNAHIAQLEAVPPSPGPTLRMSGPTGQTSPSTGTALPGALPGAPMPAANQPRPPRALFSPAIRTELGLTDEQAEEFLRLLRTGGTQADFVAAIGQEKYERYQEGQRAAARQQRVSALRTSLADGAYPLTEAQAAQLDVVLQAEQRRRIDEDSIRTRPTDPRALLAYDEASLKATQARTDQLLVEARAFLSEPQAIVLQDQLGSSLTQQEANLRLRRAQLDIGGR